MNQKYYPPKDIFQRTELLLGRDIFNELSHKKVLIVGVGGVGSWCAEGLVRSGISNLTIVDSDEVNVSNINRQLMATTNTVGEVKVEALKERLLSINPHAKIQDIHMSYCVDNADFFRLDDYDYIIDAIDTLKNKIQLILHAASSKATFFSSMGSALKVDPTRIKVADFWKVRDCPLGAALRKKMRQSKTLPERSFICVYGDEVLPNLGLQDSDEQELLHEAAIAGKAIVNGTTAPITAIFGMTLAGLVIKDIYSKG